MYLSDLLYETQNIKDVKVIGKEFKAYGREYALVGLVRTSDCTQLVLLEYIPDMALCDEIENVTNRDMILCDYKAVKALPDFLREVEIDNNTYCIYSSSANLLDESMSKDYLVFSDFIKNGWKSKKFFNYEPDCVMVHYFALETDFSEISQLKEINTKKQIKLTAYNEFQANIVEKPLRLEINREINKTIKLKDDEIIIRRVELVDVEKECDFDASDFCPKGKCIPVIEYVSKNNLDMTIALKSYLDDEINYDNEYAGCFFIQPKTNNEDSRFYTVQQPVDCDLTQIELEFVCYTKEIETPEINEFLI